MARRGRGIVAAAVATIPVAFLGGFFIWPLGATLGRAFGGEEIAGVSSSIDGRQLMLAAMTTLGLAAGATVVALATGLPAALALHRSKWRGAHAINAALSAPFVLPTVVVALAFLQLERSIAPWLSASRGVPGIVAALAFFNVAVVLRTVGPAIESVDERLIWAARALGASPLGVVTRVIWPSARKAVGAAAATTFLFCSTSFAVVLILGGTRVRTLEAATYLEVTTFLDLRAAAVIALVQAGLLVSVTVVVARLTRESSISTPTRARHAPPLTWSLAIGRVACLAPAAVLIASPLVALGLSSVGGLRHPTTRHFVALWAGSDQVAPLTSALRTSLGVAVAAAATAMTIATAVLVAGALDRRWRWLNALAAGPLAVSSVVVGVGLLIGVAVHWRSWPLGVHVLLIAAQTLVALPIVLRVMSPAIARIDPRQRAAAATLGASPLVTTIRVVLPQIRTAVASAAGISFAVAIGEFGASVFLARPDAPTVPTTILRLLGRPGADSVPTATAAAVVLAIVTAGVFVIMDVQPRRRLK